MSVFTLSEPNRARVRPEIKIHGPEVVISQTLLAIGEWLGNLNSVFNEFGDVADVKLNIERLKAFQVSVEQMRVQNSLSPKDINDLEYIVDTGNRMDASYQKYYEVMAKRMGLRKA